MPSRDVTVVFEGLMLFCQPERELRYCEVGVHTNAPDHDVRLVLKNAAGIVIPAPSANAFPCGQQLDHVVMRNFGNLVLYKGDCQTFPSHPDPGSIQVEDSFHDLLDIQGDDFYPDDEVVVDLNAGHYLPSIFISTGRLSGANPSKDNQFSRLDEETMQDLGLLTEPNKLNPQAWQDAEKHELLAFARETHVTVSLAPGEFLVLRSQTDTLICLPDPSSLGMETYRVEVRNLDSESHTYPASFQQNCPAFLHHSRALVKVDAKPKPENFGLYPTDPFLASRSRNASAQPVRAAAAALTDDACCLSGRGSRTATLQPDELTPWS